MSQAIIAILAISAFVIFFLGYVVGKAERESIAAGEPTETGVTGR
jgi:hypothetical protein